jgi:hypothetical protein
MSDTDRGLIEPYLHQNEALFGIYMTDLLRVDSEVEPPGRVCRKVEVKSLDILH